MFVFGNTAASKVKIATGASAASLNRMVESISIEKSEISPMIGSGAQWGVRNTVLVYHAIKPPRDIIAQFNDFVVGDG